MYMNDICGVMTYICQKHVCEEEKYWEKQLWEWAVGTEEGLQMHTCEQENSGTKQTAVVHTQLCFNNPVKATCARTLWNKWKRLDFHQDVQMFVVSAVHHWLLRMDVLIS